MVRKAALRFATGAAIAVASVASLHLVGCGRRPIVLHGAVIQENADPRKQSPVAGVEITALSGSASSTSQSDASGYFTIRLQRRIRSGQTVTLKFRHPEYEPLDLTQPVNNHIYIARMAPITPKPELPSNQPQIAVANVKIRYSMKASTLVNVGSAVKTFEVVNTGNLPCGGQRPCSPDGKWKAAIASTSLDAGQGNEFRNVRLSCIGGPCPFTKVVSNGYSRGGNKVEASVLNWSDTTTFLLEAEVYHPMDSELVRYSYPVIFGRALNFSLPANSEGASIEAEVGGEAVVFPLGPDLCLRWANCTLSPDQNQSRSYRCQLRPGYEFR